MGVFLNRIIGYAKLALGSILRNSLIWVHIIFRRIFSIIHRFMVSKYHAGTLTLLHSERPKLHWVLAFLSATGLKLALIKTIHTLDLTLYPNPGLGVVLTSSSNASVTLSPVFADVSMKGMFSFFASAAPSSLVTCRSDSRSDLLPHNTWGETDN